MTWRTRSTDAADGGPLFFEDRPAAGRRLAPLLGDLAAGDVVVLGLPRGGVPVAAEVARSLEAPLDVIVVRKLGVPWQPELAMGAIGEGGVRALNQEVLGMLDIPDERIAVVEEFEREELQRRVETFRGDRPPVELKGRTAVIVDDGIATGSTARAACDVARAHGATRIVLAAPVASRSAADALASRADEVVCLGTPEDFGAIGVFYRDFTQTTDEEVRRLLRSDRSTPDAEPAVRQVRIDTGELSLPGALTMPARVQGIVVFAHGSGSSRHSPRNQRVADYLARHRYGTLLFDLLSEDESADRRNVFDIELLTGRLVAATRWVEREAGGPVAYFGASTGAAAALRAAADLGDAIGAVVSRGGRPDLAVDAPQAVTAPTLFIVGSRDGEVLALNRRAAARMAAPHEVAVVEGAGHLFEESGALDAVSGLAAGWLDRHLGG